PVLWRQQLLVARLLDALQAAAQRELLETNDLLFQAGAPARAFLRVPDHVRWHAEEAANLLDREASALQHLRVLGIDGELLPLGAALQNHRPARVHGANELFR